MTVERKIIFGLEDIKAVVLECTACSSRVSIPPQVGGHIRFPTECPQCRQRWNLLEPSQYEHVISPYVNFTSSIERLRMLAKEGVESGFRLLLEFQEPK